MVDEKSLIEFVRSFEQIMNDLCDVMSAPLPRPGQKVLFKQVFHNTTHILRDVIIIAPIISIIVSLSSSSVVVNSCLRLGFGLSCEKNDGLNWICTGRTQVILLLI